MTKFERFFSYAVQQARAKRGLTQTECAARAGVDQSRWTRWESDKLDSHTIDLAAKGLDISTHRLLAEALNVDIAKGREETGPHLLGELLARARRHRGITQAALGEKMGLTKHQRGAPLVARAESSSSDARRSRKPWNVTEEWVERVAAALGTDVPALVFEALTAPALLVEDRSALRLELEAAIERDLAAAKGEATRTSILADYANRIGVDMTLLSHFLAGRRRLAEPRALALKKAIAKAVTT